MLLDKDGTLIPDVPFNVDPDRVTLAPGAERLRPLVDHGFAIVVVSNQSGIARGYFPESALSAVESRLRGLLGGLGVPLSGFYYCPHHPEGALVEYALWCECRKPRSGMLLRAAREHGLDLQRSWMVGDILDDVAAGSAAGCRTILVDQGHETEWLLCPGRIPDLLVPNLGTALAAIACHSQPSRDGEGAGS